MSDGSGETALAYRYSNRSLVPMVLGFCGVMPRIAFCMLAHHAAQLFQIFFTERAFLKKLVGLAFAIFLRCNAGAQIPM
ncbi:MAG: hypothetical protein KA972_06450 [Brachymonas sp.]|nr:hypothetical protein [Brachymonas sp.]